MSTPTVGNMASVPLEDYIRCCICLDVYTDPVSIPCGHNFCLDCIQGFWDSRDRSECPLCKTTFRPRPPLRINTAIGPIVEAIKGQKPVEEELQRDWLTDPAAFRPSHLCTKHNKPLSHFCRHDHAPVCEMCTAREHKHHKVVTMERETKKVKVHLRETMADIQRVIQARLRKMAEIQNSVDLSKKITEREIQSSYQVCSVLIAAVEKQQAALAEELEERQRDAERKGERLLDELEREIRRLQARMSELHQLEASRSPLLLLQSFPSLSKLPSTRDWSEVAVQQDNCMGAVRRAVSELVDVCRELTNKLSAVEAEKMSQYAVDVTLDPETASRWVHVSPDGKKVSLSSQTKTAPDHPRRFDSCVCVLGKQSFTSGRRFWVVEVGDKPDWDLGVAQESINRKGAITVRPDGGFWAICRRRGGSLSACTSPSVPLPLQETPRKVGVFLDYEEGSVSFFDAEAKTHIYTYSGCTFTEPLHPYFNPCVQDNGRNVAPLVICPLEGPVREGPGTTIESDV